VAPAFGGQHDRTAVALAAYVGFDGDVVDERGVVGDFDPEETDPAVAVVGVPEMVVRGGVPVGKSCARVSAALRAAFCADWPDAATLCAYCASPSARYGLY